MILLGWSFGVFDILSYVRDHGTDRLAGLILCDETPTCPADPADPDAVLFLRLAFDARTEF